MKIISNYASPAPEDYLHVQGALNGSVFIGASESSVTMSVVIVNDSLLEDREEFVVSVSLAFQQESVEISSHNTTIYITNEDSKSELVM